MARLSHSNGVYYNERDIMKPFYRDRFKSSTRNGASIRDGLVVNTLAPRPRDPGFNSWSDRTLHHVAAVGKLLTLNCLGTKQCMKGATIGSCLLCE
jgi:hypothetical protein